MSNAACGAREDDERTMENIGVNQTSDADAELPVGLQACCRLYFRPLVIALRLHCSFLHMYGLFHSEFNTNAVVMVYRPPISKRPPTHRYALIPL